MGNRVTLGDGRMLDPIGQLQQGYIGRSSPKKGDSLMIEIQWIFTVL